jgi:hypothetical protein
MQHSSPNTPPVVVVIIRIKNVVPELPMTIEVVIKHRDVIPLQVFLPRPFSSPLLMLMLQLHLHVFTLHQLSQRQSPS